MRYFGIVYTDTTYIKKVDNKYCCVCPKDGNKQFILIYKSFATCAQNQCWKQMQTHTFVWNIYWEHDLSRIQT